MEVLKATESDLPRIVDLWWEMQSSHNEYDPRFYKTKSESECRNLARTYFSIMIADKDHLILLANEGGKTVGMIHLQISIKPPVYSLERYASIREAVVSKPYRNRGIFRLLLNHAKDLLRLEKISLLEVGVDVSNPASDVYKRAGFTTREQLMINWI
jgi:ribosomal protein S18 acetylase RimI-like enzyme